MSRVTSKYQVSIPKALADKVGIRPGDDLTWEEAGGALRVRLGKAPQVRFPVEVRLKLFDAATARQKQRERVRRLPPSKDRGWTREELYDD